VSILRDNGCGGVVVREGLVDKESFVDGQQECMMADGSVIKTFLLPSLPCEGQFIPI
jgi:hypothetical protein